MAVDMTDKAHAPGVPGTDGQGVSAGMEHKGRAAQGRARQWDVGGGGLPGRSESIQHILVGACYVQDRGWCRGYGRDRALTSRIQGGAGVGEKERRF